MVIEDHVLTIFNDFALVKFVWCWFLLAVRKSSIKGMLEAQCSLQDFFSQY